MSVLPLIWNPDAQNPYREVTAAYYLRALHP